MNKKLLTLVFLCFHILINAQETKEKFSFNFQEISLKNALETIENKSDHKFFFESEWLDSEEKTSGIYTDLSIEEILNSVLKKTDLNFLILDKKIILTKNRIIYDSLPDNYFANEPSTNSKESDIEIAEKPLFYNQNDSITNKKSTAIKPIGKESGKAQKKFYTLSGYVKDIKTGSPLVNATIKSNSQMSVSDENGFYKLQLPYGINSLEIESMNHKKTTQKVVVYNDGTLSINLEENINTLEEVVINSEQRAQLRAAVSGVTTIDIQSIKNIPLILGERDIFKVATALPGIKTVGEGAAGFNVRGGKEDQNLILLDNAQIYNPSHFFGLFSAINSFTIDKANIYKGSIPSEFGGKLSSVFDISSKNGNLEKVTGEGGIGPVTSNLTVSTPIVKGKSSLLVGARATYSDWILKALKEESLKNSKASFYDAILKYSHTINKNNDIEATFYYSHDAFKITSDSLNKYSNRLASLKWDHIFNEKHKGSLIITNSEYKFNIDYDSEPSNSFDFGYKINETQGMLKMNYTINEKHKLTYGLSSKLYNINPGSFSPKNQESLLVEKDLEKEKALESAVYVSDSYKITDDLLLDVGLRYSTFASLGSSTQRIYQSGVPLTDASVVETKTFGNNEVAKSYGGLEPRIAARYLVTNDFSVKASYDKAYQYIHLLSNNTTQSPTDTWKLSDLNVKPQVAEQFSLGFYKTLSNDELEISLEGYYKKSNNFLDYKVGAELVMNENIETQLLQGKGKAYGIEFLLKKSEGRLNGWIGYTYSRTFVKLDSQFSDERVNNGDYFSANFDKPHDISVVLNYKLTKRYSFSSNFVYQTGRPITYPIGTYNYGGSEYTLYSDRNKFRIPDYYRLDIGVNIEGNHKIKKLAHSFWNISVYNVLGRNNPYSIYFVTESGEIKAYKTSIFGMPIPTITYNFKF